MIKIIGPRDKPDASAINTTSHSANDWSSGLSPFKLGPLSLYDNHTAQYLRTLGNSPSSIQNTPTPKANPPLHIGTGPNVAGTPSEHTVTHWAKDANLSAHSGMVKDLTISPLANKSTCHSTKQPWPRLTLITDLKKPTAETDRSLFLISMAMITPA